MDMETQCGTANGDREMLSLLETRRGDPHHITYLMEMEIIIS
jgi:hypothetical protein